MRGSGLISRTLHQAELPAHLSRLPFSYLNLSFSGSPPHSYDLTFPHGSPILYFDGWLKPLSDILLLGKGDLENLIGLHIHQLKAFSRYGDYLSYAFIDYRDLDPCIGWTNEAPLSAVEKSNSHDPNFSGSMLRGGEESSAYFPWLGLFGLDDPRGLPIEEDGHAYLQRTCIYRLAHGLSIMKKEYSLIWFFPFMA